MRAFVHDVLPGRVVFGRGSIAELEAELEALGSERAMVVATPRRGELVEELKALAPTRLVSVHAKAVEHVPIHSVDEAEMAVREARSDCLVAAGGGSAIGLAKAVALRTGLPIVAIPTTYSGSEMTPVYGVTENGRKVTGRDPMAKPRTVIFDPLLTLPLLPLTSAESGVNAMAHCVEGLYARNADPVFSLMAKEGLRRFAESLPILVNNPRDVQARESAMYAAYLSGSVLASVGMALHHKLCHVLGGTYKLPHAKTHGVILPYAVAYNMAYADEASAIVARALGAPEHSAASALREFVTSLGLPASLRELGMQEADLDEAAAIATLNPYDNPAPIEEENVRRLLEFAFYGRDPGAWQGAQAGLADGMNRATGCEDEADGKGNEPR